MSLYVANPIFCPIAISARHIDNSHLFPGLFMMVVGKVFPAALVVTS